MWMAFILVVFVFSSVLPYFIDFGFIQSGPAGGTTGGTSERSWGYGQITPLLFLLLPILNALSIYSAKTSLLQKSTKLRNVLALFLMQIMTLNLEARKRQESQQVALIRAQGTSGAGTQKRRLESILRCQRWHQKTARERKLAKELSSEKRGLKTLEPPPATPHVSKAVMSVPLCGK
ncbi:hypothetical protein ACEPPN_010318 [Leptodophora sp. 'Broadleaf-Isolate-01']